MLRIFYTLAGLTLVHLRTALKRGSESRDLAVLFDATYYLSNQPDVANSRWLPEWHYFLHGATEGRNPHPLFDTAFYLAAYPDVKRSWMNPLHHYILYGAQEGRDASRSAVGMWPHPSAENASSNPLVRHILRQGGRAVAAPAAIQKVPAASSAGPKMELPTPVSESAKLRLAQVSLELSQALANSNSLVSVVIASYNYGRLVSEAVSSVLAQSYANVEVIVVDDESTDPETIAVLAAIRNPRVTVIRQFNQGLAQTRNNGAAVATGQYLMFLDCDDRLERHAVGLLLYSLQGNPSVAYAYPYQRFFGDQELVWETQPFNAYDLRWSNHPTVCCLIRRDAFREVGGFRPEFFRGGEDWELFLRLSGRGHLGMCVPAPVFEYRRHGTTMAHSLEERRDRVLGQMLAINSTMFEPDAVTAVKKAWRPLLSVIIPFYNRHRYLGETLDSLRAQTTQDFEVILANDGSTDAESLAMLNSLRAEGWVRVLDLPHAGRSAARNRAAKEARAELILFLDSDDLLEPTAIEKLCWSIASKPQFAFVYSGVVHFGDLEATTYAEFDPARLHKENFLTVTCVMRREVYLELGGNDPAMSHSWEDYDFWLRLVAKGYSGWLFREPLFHYRRHAEGISRLLVKDAGVSLEELSRLVVVRHLARQGVGQLAPLVSNHATVPGLVEKVSEALRDVVPPSVHAERYRRTNLPDLFAPKYWSSDKVTILYLIPSFDVGGAEVFDLGILSCLPRDLFCVVLVACDRPEGRWYDEYKAAVDEIFCLRRMAGDEDGKMAFLHYLMIAKCVDIVFTRNTSYGYRLADAWPNLTKQVRYVDLMHLHAFGEDWVEASSSYHNKLDLRYVTSGDLPEYAAKRYHLPANQFKVLDYGFEARELPDEATRVVLREKIRERWNISPSSFVVGFVGRLTDQKDPLRWLAIASQIADREPQASFLVVGDGELRDAVVAEASRLRLNGKMIFTGYQRDAAQHCAAMDVLLMTSKYEGVPMVVLHALAHGSGVVSSDVGGIGRCLNERTGRIVPSDASASGYVEAVLEWREVLRTDVSIGVRCREAVAARFCKDRMRRGLIHDLTSLVSSVNLDERRTDYQLDLMKKPILW